MIYFPDRGVRFCQQPIGRRLFVPTAEYGKQLREDLEQWEADCVVKGRKQADRLFCARRRVARAKAANPQLSLLDLAPPRPPKPLLGKTTAGDFLEGRHERKA